MNYHIQYDTPKRKDICVAFAFFSPCGYVRPLQNLLFFENKLRLANIPYFSAEMIIEDQMPMLSNPTCVYRSKSYLFYKEELFNKLEKMIPEQYTKIIFLDTDIIFNCTNWVDRISDLLDTNDIIQVFEQVKYLDLTYNEIYSTIASTVDLNPSGCGFGWAMTRSFLSKIGGFFDKCTLGSGDSILFNSIVNRPVIKYPLIQEFIENYRKKVAIIKPEWTFLEGVIIYHLSHGSRVNRKYLDRYAILNKSDFTWDSIFYKNSDDFWELKDKNINAEFLEYFKDRNEDSTSSFTTLSNNNIQTEIPLHTESKTSASEKIPEKIPVQEAKILVHPPIKYANKKFTRSYGENSIEIRPISRYIANKVNIQRIHNLNPASAAAVRSMEKRANIRNTVVYNRTSVTPSINYDSDEYSD